MRICDSCAARVEVYEPHPSLCGIAATNEMMRRTIFAGLTGDWTGVNAWNEQQRRNRIIHREWREAVHSSTLRAENLGRILVTDRAHGAILSPEFTADGLDPNSQRSVQSFMQPNGQDRAH